MTSIGGPRFPPDTPLFGALLAGVVAGYLLISQLALAMFGFNYEATGGSVIEKIHPATLLALITLTLAGLLNRNPLSAALSALARRPSIVAYILMVGIACAHAIFVSKQPFTPLIDTFIAPVLVFFLFKDLSARRALRLGNLVHALMALNAIIGIGEYLTGARLTPIVAEGVAIDDEWRSSALLGHPLANASLVGAYLLALAVGPGRTLPQSLTAAAFVFNAAGMVVFGGRAATVFLIVMLAAVAALGLLKVMRGARFDTGLIVKLLILAPFAALAIAVLGEAGFFDQFIARFFDDNGSAGARVEMFEMLKYFSWPDLLTGPDPDRLLTLRRLHGLDFGIESFWLSFSLTYGLIVAIPFFAALFAFCRETARATLPGAATILIFFFLVGSTSVSLSSKSPLFAILEMMILILLSPSLGARFASSTGGEPGGVRLARGAQVMWRR